MKKLIFFILFSSLITSLASARSTGCKEGNCDNGYGSGFTQIKQLTKVNGLQQKNMAKEPKHGRMDIFTKVNLKKVNGAV